MSKPLLQIILDDINSVPTVYYNGEMLLMKQRVTFDWKTNDAMSNYPTFINIEQLDTEDVTYRTKVKRHNNPITSEVMVEKLNDYIKELEMKLKGLEMPVKKEDIDKLNWL